MKWDQNFDQKLFVFLFEWKRESIDDTVIANEK